MTAANQSMATKPVETKPVVAPPAKTLPIARQPISAAPPAPAKTSAAPPAPGAASEPTPVASVPPPAALPAAPADLTSPPVKSPGVEPAPRPLERADFAGRSWSASLPDGSVLQSSDLEIPDSVLATLTRPGADVYPWKDPAHNLEGRFQYKHFERDKAFRLDGLGLTTEHESPRGMLHLEEGKREGAFLVFNTAGGPTVAGTYHNDLVDGAVWWIDRGVPLVAELRRAGVVVDAYLIVVDPATQSLAAAARAARRSRATLDPRTRFQFACRCDLARRSRAS